MNTIPTTSFILRRLLTVLVLMLASLRTLSAAEEIDDDLTVTGNLTVEGAGALEILSNQLNFGNWGGGAEGFVLNYQDNGNSTASVVTLSGSRPSVQWLWETDGLDTPTPQMLLDETGTLTLYGAAGNLTLSPGNITFNGSAGNVTFTSSGVTLGNQTLVWGPGASASGTGALAFGANATASGHGALAFGSGAVAQAWSSVVVGHNSANLTSNATAWDAKDAAFVVGIGQNTANRKNGLVVLNNGNLYSGNYTSINSTHGLPEGYGPRLMYLRDRDAFIAGGPPSSYPDRLNYENIGQSTVAIGRNIYLSNGEAQIALGYYPTTSSGSGAVAVGYSPVAASTGAVAIGYVVTANAYGAVALGVRATANYPNSLVAGTWNTLPTASDAQQPIFQMGNGTSNTTRSDAFVVLRNGNTTVGGALTVTTNATVTGNATVNGALTVAGNTTHAANTTTTFSENSTVNFHGTVTFGQRYGDIEMGEFGAPP